MYEQQLNAFVTELTEFANNTPDYELIRSENAVDLVYDTIEQYHAETGKILSHKEACDAVEAHLFEQAKKMLEREKIKKLYSAPAPATPKAAPGKPTTLSTWGRQMINQVKADTDEKGNYRPSTNFLAQLDKLGVFKAKRKATEMRGQETGTGFI